MVNDEAPDLETLVEDSGNKYAIRQYIRMGDEISRLRTALATRDARIAELEEASREVLRTWDHYGVIHHPWDLEPLRTALGLPAPKAKGGE